MLASHGTEAEACVMVKSTCSLWGTVEQTDGLVRLETPIVRSF